MHELQMFVSQWTGEWSLNNINGRKEVEGVGQWGVKDIEEFIDFCMEMEQTWLHPPAGHRW